MEDAGARGGAALVEAVADQQDSPGVLLDRGTALLHGGHSSQAVGVLDAAMAAWEEEVSRLQVVNH